MKRLGLVLLVACSTKEQPAAEQTSAASDASKLSKEQAVELLRASHESNPDAKWNCIWSGATKHSERLATFLPFDTMKCARALETLGIAKVGACTKPGCGDCCGQEIAPVDGKSKIDNRGLLFNCGHWKLHGAETVTTEGAKATATIEIEWADDAAVIDALQDCALVKATPGRQKNDYNFARGDDGVWVYKKKR